MSFSFGSLAMNAIAFGMVLRELGLKFCDGGVDEENAEEFFEEMERAWKEAFTAALDSNKTPPNFGTWAEEYAKTYIVTKRMEES